MCFDLDSEPPIPRISGAAVSHDDLVLESEDGNRFAAFRAVPEEDLSTGVVILPDVRGLYRFYEELALRFAERGHAAVAFDYFGRTAGVDKRPDDWDYCRSCSSSRTSRCRPTSAPASRPAGARLQRDLHGRLLLRRQRILGGSRLGHGLAGAVGFYGRPGRMIELVPRLDAPILALQGGADQAISPRTTSAFEQALRDAGKEHELVEFEARRTLLRPQAGGVPGGFRRRLAPDARVSSRSTPSS